MPTLHLTNFTSRKLHRGAVYSIMAKPRPHFGELGAGTVYAFVPAIGNLEALQAGQMSPEAYFYAFRAGLDARLAVYADRFAPQRLLAGRDNEAGVFVQDGDTLCCACARGAPCHRRELAPYLVRAGWDIVLDGTPFTLVPTT